MNMFKEKYNARNENYCALDTTISTLIWGFFWVYALIQTVNVMQQFSLNFEFVIILKDKTFIKLLRFYFFCSRELYLVGCVLFEGWVVEVFRLFFCLLVVWAFLVVFYWLSKTRKRRNRKGKVGTKTQWTNRWESLYIICHSEMKIPCQWKTCAPEKDTQVEMDARVSRNLCWTVSVMWLCSPT